ncbi:MAG: basic amino acid/polyamine antiporter [Coriobacteriaceae bacterium]|nr:basic amino acid/polyamine antiporter [Coriobacteriaceae bacterium]
MSDSTQQADAREKRGISLIGLIALVISSSIGSGVFALSTDISAAAAPGPALIAWLITGIGFMALATTFGRLSIVRPDLNGIVDYAREGFGPFVGFVSGWGYWLSIWIGNVAFGVMLVTAIGYFYPPFAGNLSVAGVAFISILNWAIILLVNRGVEEASVLNAIVMVCKLVPIFAFILAMLVMFSFDVFTADFWGNLANNMANPELAPGTVGTQIINCFMVMMWVFVGMEGASVLGHRAQRKSDVSRATILGCTALVIIYVAASILPYGYLSREELMALGSPSMPYIFERVVGPWGGAFISGGLIISIFGAWLSYTILASEAMHGMARMRLLPSAFDKLNTFSAPTTCLITTGVMIQLLSIVMLFSERAYQFAYSLCTASIIISWTLAAGYMVKLRFDGRKRGTSAAPAVQVRGIDVGLAAFSVAFLVIAVLLSGVQQLMMCCIAYIPGIACYVWARVEQRQTVFTTRERLLAAILVAIGIFMIAQVAMNGIA